MKGLLLVLLLSMVLAAPALGQQTATNLLDRGDALAKQVATNSGISNATLNGSMDCNSVDYSKLKKIEGSNEVYYIDSNGQKQGTYKEYWDEDRKKLCSIGCYQNGNKTSHWISYNDDGISKSSEGDYSNNTKNGHWINYWDNGTKSGEGEYKNDMMQSYWIFHYPNGDISAERNYKDDKLDGYCISYYGKGCCVE